MLLELRLINFRGFEDHCVPLRDLSIIVGRNNAGKSSIVEALRLISIVTSRHQNLTYRPPPTWLEAPAGYGATLDLRNLMIDFESIGYEYRNPPTIIEASFSNQSKVRIYLGKENQVHAVVLNKDGRAVRNRTEARRVALPRVSIMPQVAPLLATEKQLSPDYVRGAIDSPLSPLHFRNQLLLWQDLFEEFKALAEETWSGFRVLDLEPIRGYPGDQLFLQVRNEEFVGEVVKMGHGLQMWIQTIWFLTRSKGSATIILDEPDVYMHPDLQRKLIRYLKNHASQVIVTTHSVEILSEIDPDQILVIERKQPSSRFADSIPAVQRLIERVGSVHNIQLARLWNARRFLLVEGDDLKILKHIYDTLYPEIDASLEAIPNMSIGGWGGWNWAIGSTLTLKNAIDQRVVPYCIFDRDYHTDSEIDQRVAQAVHRGVQIHIWQKKELENYLLHPAAISRIIAKQSPTPPTPQTINEFLNTQAITLKEDVLDGISSELQAENRGLNAGGANKRARQILASREEQHGILNLVSGKQLVSLLSAWTQANFKVSLSAISLSHELRQDEIPNELQMVLKSIHSGTNFEPWGT